MITQYVKFDKAFNAAVMNSLSMFILDAQTSKLFFVVLFQEACETEEDCCRPILQRSLIWQIFFPCINCRSCICCLLPE